MGRLICLWSGPRNVSTALMYAFAQRDDMEVVDEPLYGWYLSQSGADHPGRDDVLAAQSHDGDEVVQQLRTRAAQGQRHLFCKMMAHHLPGLDRDFLRSVTNLLLIRDPVEVLATLVHQVPEPTLADTGYAEQARLLRADLAADRRPVVINARTLRNEPESTLRAALSAIDLEFDPTMLDWPAGAKAFDGVWAPHWYHNVHKSTRFQPWQPPRQPVPDHLQALLDECRPLYKELLDHAIAT